MNSRIAERVAASLEKIAESSARIARSHERIADALTTDGDLRYDGRTQDPDAPRGETMPTLVSLVDGIRQAIEAKGRKS